MTTLPPLLRDPRHVDAEHLRLLAVFHFVVAGFAVLGVAMILGHALLMHTIFGNPELWKDAKGGPPPAQLMAMFRWFYIVAVVFVAGGGAANLFSGLALLQRKARTFSLVVAGLNCMMFPMGTALGIFTFIVLLRDSVADAYRARRG